jgi:Zn-dependent M28 family amino/carboxypeptidase
LISCKAEQIFALKTDFSNQNVAFLVEDWSNFLELFAHDFQIESKEIVDTKPQKSNAKFFINKSRFYGEDESFCFEKRQRNEVISTENILVPFIRNTHNKETILISAHYDHLGVDSLGYYPGADDNASGVAILLEVLREYQNSANFDSTKNVVFAFFSGEEQGLFGSEYFVNSDLFLNYSIDLCINLDMVGFVAKDFLYAIHYHQVQELLQIDFPESVELEIEHMAQENFLFEFSSDQRSFFDQGVPSIMLFTGLHTDYHTPNDTPEQLDYEKMTYLKSWLIDFLK